MARIENLNLSQRVTNALGLAIISGRYPVDTGLPTEAQLCEEYGVSRTAIREAVKMLAAKGLVSSRPRQGIKVEASINWNLYDTAVLKWLLESSPSLFVLKEFLQMRLAIEPHAAALAAQNASAEDLSKIAHAVDLMEEAAKEDTGNMHEGDLAFHESILLASHNRFFFQLRDFITTALNVSIQHSTPAKGNKIGIVEDHRRIYLAILNKQPERAKNMMMYLIDEAMSFIEAEINQTVAK